MAGSSLGNLFVVTNFGESHGVAIGCVIDGCPAGLPLTEADIQPDLDRRKPGGNRFVTQRKESDTVQILSGVYEGKTTGTPIALLIPNENQRSKDYASVADQFRPAHADWGYHAKFGIRDPRGGGRSSARLTAPTVAAGAVAKKWLQTELGMSFRACVTSIGSLNIPIEDWSYVGENPFFVANRTQVAECEALVDQTRRSGDSIGATLRLEIQGVPAGLGNPIYDRLDAKLAYALMGLNAVKGVEIEDGFSVASKLGSENADAMNPNGFVTNHAGGTLGGISSGAPIVINIAIKPTPSILIPTDSIDSEGQPCEVVTKGRHDPCVGLRAAPVVEALAALVLMDAVLAQRAQQGNCGRIWP